MVKSIRRPIAILSVIMAVFMMFSALSISASAFDTSTREGVCAVVFYVKNAKLLYYDPATDKYIVYSNLGDTQFSSGSGFFVGKEGEDPQYIVTNFHVIDGYVEANEGETFVQYAGQMSGYNFYYTGSSCELRIYYSQDDYDIAYVDCYGSLDKLDLAVLRLKNPTDKRKPLKLMGPSNDMVGDTVYTIGYPGNADNSFTGASQYGIEDSTVHKGSVSRIVVNEGKGVERISTDATIQHGNSGGPLVTEDGYVIGVNTNGIVNASDLEIDYYAISSNDLMRFLDKNDIYYETSESGGAASGLGTIVIVAIVVGVLILVAGVVIVLVVVLRKNSKPAVATATAAAVPVAAAVAANAGGAATTASLKAVIRSMAAQHNGATFPVGKAPVTIGRNGASCVVVYQEGTQGVSGVHCSVSFDSATGLFTLTDLGSTFGTFLISGQKLNPNSPVALRSGDCFYVGDKANMCRVEVEK